MHFELPELISMSLAAMAAAVHLCLGVLGWDPLQKRPTYNLIFLCFCACVAWYCMGEGLVHAGWFRYHEYFVPSPLFTGYAFALMSLVMRHWLDESFEVKKRHLWLLLGGIPGTLYTLLSLQLDARTAAWLRDAYAHGRYLDFFSQAPAAAPEQAVWIKAMEGMNHLHLLSMSLFLLYCGYLLFHSYRQRHANPDRADYRWILLAFTVGTMCVLVSAFIPLLIPDLRSSYLGPMATIPLSGLFYRVLLHKRRAYQNVLQQRQQLSRYLPQDLVDQIMQNKQDGRLGGDESHGVILFCDIRSFTSLAEQLTPRALLTVLNAYYASMNQVVARFEGVVNKYIGDEIMVIFGLGQHPEKSAAAAYACALAMIEELETFNATCLPPGLSPFQIGIGIHAGNLVHGNIGSPERMEYSVLGDTVNTAARLVSLTSSTREPLLISEAMLRLIGPLAEGLVLLDHVTLKGQSRPTAVYRLLRADDRRNAS